MDPCKKGLEEYKKKINQAWEDIKMKYKLTDDELFDIISNEHGEFGEVIDEWEQALERIKEEVEKKYEKEGVWIEHEGGSVRAYNGDCDNFEDVSP